MSVTACRKTLFWCLAGLTSSARREKLEEVRRGVRGQESAGVLESRQRCTNDLFHWSLFFSMSG